MWPVPLNCSFTWLCSLGILMTGIVISHHIMGMTLLSCCWVTSRFRLPKHMSSQLFFTIWWYLLIYVCPLSRLVHERTHAQTHTHRIHKVRSFFRRAGINIYALAKSINTSGQSKNQCTPATYFNLPMKVTLLPQCLGGRSTLTHINTHAHAQTKQISQQLLHPRHPDPAPVQLMSLN